MKAQLTFFPNDPSKNQLKTDSAFNKEPKPKDKDDKGSLEEPPVLRDILTQDILSLIWKQDFQSNLKRCSMFYLDSYNKTFREISSIPQEAVLYIISQPAKVSLRLVGKYFAAGSKQVEKLANNYNNSYWSAICYALVTPLYWLHAKKLKASIKFLNSEKKQNHDNPGYIFTLNNLIRSLKITQYGLSCLWRQYPNVPVKPEYLKSLLQKNNRYCNLQGAHLSFFDLQKITLRGINLRGSDLYRTNLQDSDLRESDLWDARLWYAVLHRTDLRGLNLGGDYLTLINRTLASIMLVPSVIQDNKISSLICIGLCITLCTGLAEVLEYSFSDPLDGVLLGIILYATLLLISIPHTLEEAYLFNTNLQGAIWNQETSFPSNLLGEIFYLKEDFADIRQLKTTFIHTHTLIIGHKQEKAIKAAVAKQFLNESDKGNELLDRFDKCLKSCGDAATTDELVDAYDKIDLLLSNIELQVDSDDESPSGFTLS